MISEKMKGKALTDEQMENVAGGTYSESMQVAYFLQQAGFQDTVKCTFFVNFNGMRNAISQLGFVSQDHGGIVNENTYVEKATGKVYSQDEFMNYLKQRFPNVK